MSSNAKVQRQCDDAIYKIGLSHLPVITQLFYLSRNGTIVLLVIKNVDDLYMNGEDGEAQSFCQKLNNSFELGTNVRCAGIMKVYGLKIFQNDDYCTGIHVDEQFNAFECLPLSRIRRGQRYLSLNAIENSFFKSVNSPLGCHGIAASPLCAFYASYLQQKLPTLTVSSITSQV